MLVLLPCIPQRARPTTRHIQAFLNRRLVLALPQETLVVSHGAQIGARRIFPCDDRPIAKATFQLVNTVVGVGQAGAILNKGRPGAADVR